MLAACRSEPMEGGAFDDQLLSSLGSASSAYPAVSSKVWGAPAVLRSCLDGLRTLAGTDWADIEDTCLA